MLVCKVQEDSKVIKVNPVIYAMAFHSLALLGYPGFLDNLVGLLFRVQREILVFQVQMEGLVTRVLRGLLVPWEHQD